MAIGEPKRSHTENATGTVSPRASNETLSTLRRSAAGRCTTFRTAVPTIPVSRSVTTTCVCPGATDRSCEPVATDATPESMTEYSSAAPGTIDPSRSRATTDRVSVSPSASNEICEDGSSIDAITCRTTTGALVATPVDESRTVTSAAPGVSASSIRGPENLATCRSLTSNTRSAFAIGAPRLSWTIGTTVVVSRKASSRIVSRTSASDPTRCCTPTTIVAVAGPSARRSVVTPVALERTYSPWSCATAVSATEMATVVSATTRPRSSRTT